MKDVIVVGGGTAGFVAAIAAARNGADTMIIEQETCLGGTLTGGLVPGIVSLRHQSINKVEDLLGLESIFSGNQVVKGIGQEFVNELIKAGAAYGEIDNPGVRVTFDQEVAKLVIDKMVAEAGVEVRYCSKVTSVLKEGRNVKGIKINSNREIIGKAIIDATGDGNVSFQAGAEYAQGKDQNPNFVQPLSFYFLIGGVNFNKTLKYIETHPEDFGEAYIEKLIKLKKERKPITLSGFSSLRKKAVENGEYPLMYGSDFINPKGHTDLMRPVYKNGKVRYELSLHNVDMAYKIDPTNSAELSNAIIGMRNIIEKLCKFYRNYLPGFEDSYLLQIASLVGIRESRRIIGDYILNGEEVLNGSKFDDSIGRCGAVIDLHNIEGGKERVWVEEIKGDGSYQVPYRILLPRGLDGLLLAGRCVSSDRIANGSIRQQAGCFVTGQGAGTAAALSIKNNVNPRNLDIKELQNTLTSQNTMI